MPDGIRGVLGSLVGAFAVYGVATACGQVDAGSMPDGMVTEALADGPADSRLIADAPIEAPTYRGFSYYTSGFVHPAGWGRLVAGVLDYNTFGEATYDVTTGTFSVPATGYYRLSAHGFIATGATSPDPRVGLAVVRNGKAVAVSGGQLSAADTPGVQISHVLHLDKGDTVKLDAYSPVEITFGAASSPEYRWWFQGEYAGE